MASDHRASGIIVVWLCLCVTSSLAACDAFAEGPTLTIDELHNFVSMQDRLLRAYGGGDAAQLDAAFDKEMERISMRAQEAQVQLVTDPARLERDLKALGFTVERDAAGDWIVKASRANALAVWSAMVSFLALDIDVGAVKWSRASGTAELRMHPIRLPPPLPSSDTLVPAPPSPTWERVDAALYAKAVANEQRIAPHRQKLAALDRVRNKLLAELTVIEKTEQRRATVTALRNLLVDRTGDSPVATPWLSGLSFEQLESGAVRGVIQVDPGREPALRALLAVGAPDVVLTTTPDGVHLEGPARRH